LPHHGGDTKVNKAHPAILSHQEVEAVDVFVIHQVIVDKGHYTRNFSVNP
jgi:hypothetical protein